MKKTKTINIDVDLYEQIKLYCVENNITVRDFISITVSKEVDNHFYNKYVKKWSIILRETNIQKKYYPIVSKYLEEKINRETKYVDVSSLNTIPLNIKILSKLDLSTIKFTSNVVNRENVNIISDVGFTLELPTDLSKLIKTSNYTNEQILNEPVILSFIVDESVKIFKEFEDIVFYDVISSVKQIDKHEIVDKVVFKIHDKNLINPILKHLELCNVEQDIGILNDRVFLGLNGVEPTNNEGEDIIEFLGFSKVDGLPLFVYKKEYIDLTLYDKLKYGIMTLTDDGFKNNDVDGINFSLIPNIDDHLNHNIKISILSRGYFKK